MSEAEEWKPGQDTQAVATARLTKARLAPGKQASVSVPLPTLCPTYLVAARAT